MTDPQTLFSQAQCYLCLGISISEALQLALLAQIANNGGGGGGAQAQLVPYTAAPPDNPTDPTKPAIAYDPTGALPMLGWNTNTLSWN